MLKITHAQKLVHSNGKVFVTLGMAIGSIIRKPNTLQKRDTEKHSRILINNIRGWWSGLGILEKNSKTVPVP